MRNYYISNSNIIYTEREKTQSVWPGCQFELIGSFRSRREAINIEARKAAEKKGETDHAL